MNNFFSKNSTKSALYWLCFVLLSLLVCFLCFYKLGDGTIQIWDEVRHGISGYEMLKNKEYIVTTYNNSPDYWNLKPPMSIYGVALGYKLFGYNLFGLRFYSALSMLLTAIGCGLFAKKRMGRIASLFTLLGFASAYPLIEFHCARNGDADSLYILFFTLALLTLCNYASEEKDGWLWLSCLGFSFAFLTKSFHAGTIGMLILVYLLASKRLFRFRLKQWLKLILSTAGPVLIWGILRFAKDGTAFFKEMVRTDLLGRSTGTMDLDSHSGGLTFYLDYLLDYHFILPVALLIFFAIFLVKEEVSSEKSLLRILFGGFLFPFLFFTAVSTKLQWYIFCAIPALILMAALGGEYLWNQKKNRARLCLALPVLLLLLCCYTNVQNVRSTQADGSAADVLLTLADRDPDYSGAHLYRYADDGEDWKQDGIFAAELSGDFAATEGSLSAWESDAGSYLLIQEDLLDEVTADYTVIRQAEGYALILN